MKQDITNLKNELVAQIISATSAAELFELESAYLGKQGKITSLVKNEMN